MMQDDFEDFHVRVFAENKSHEGFFPEHGLSLGIHFRGMDVLFDTGAGKALPYNAEKFGCPLCKYHDLILSHGHNDHTGGIITLKHLKKIYYVPGIFNERFSLHEDGTINSIGMPKECHAFLENISQFVIKQPTAIFDGWNLTGEIPHVVSTGCSEKFFLDKSCTLIDSIKDEQALLLANGVLITGCCHAGLINTIEFCKKSFPNISIRVIIGGLHFLHACEKDLQDIVEYIQKKTCISAMHLMHCTGEYAIAYLQQALPNIHIDSFHAGDSF